MSSSRLEDFHRFWTRKGELIANEHWDELYHYVREADKKRQLAREDAQTQLEDLLNRDTRADFDDEARKIKENLNTTLKSIKKEYDEIIGAVKETQRKELADHEKAYHEAVAARPFLHDTLPCRSTTDTVPTIDNAIAPNGGDTASASESAGPPYDPVLAAQDPIPLPTASEDQDQSAVPGKHFSCTVQPLQEITERRANPSLPADTSVDPSPTSITTTSTPDHEPGFSRTITFDEVYQNGQAKHKDTIIEFPPTSGQWYIIKCEEHQMRFGKRPLMGAAKHLNGRLHGRLEKSWTVALQVLGYRVIGCTKELAARNNEAVNEAFAKGYTPVSLINPENKVKRKRNSEMATEAIQKEHSGNGSHGTSATAVSRKKSGTSWASIGCNTASPHPGKRRKAHRKPPTEIITNPKTFHVYYCFWKPHNCLYPVMILAWDDQKPGGLEHDLVSTGLLDEKSNPPNCYIYKDTLCGKNKAIAGWAPGFEDGGSKVTQRKFPAMFFDNDQGVSWVSANLLSKFPLFKPNSPKRKSHPFNMARRWIAKNKGFASWEEFEAARKKGGKEDPGLLVPTPSVSPLSDVNDARSDSDTENSSQSSTSHVTENELQEMLDVAGEITGDSDYAGSDADSTLEGEYEEWDQVETDGRPWAWYGLRNKTHTSPQKPETSIVAPENDAANNKSVISDQEGMNAARRLSTQACNQDEGDSGPRVDTSLLENTPKGTTLENPALDGEDKSSRSTPVANLCAANAVNQATPPPRPVSRHSTGSTGKNNRAEGNFQTTSLAPTELQNQPSLSLAELGEVSKGKKRARTEEGAETSNDTPGQANAKKPRQDTGTSDNQMAMSIDSEPTPTPTPPAPAPGPIAAPFKPRSPPGPAVFELSSYSKGHISWRRESEASSLHLYAGEGDRVVGTMDGPVAIAIDPTRLRGLTREEIPGSKGNVVMTLFSQDPDEAPVRVVFDRPAGGSRADIGKVQSRKFIRWIRGIVPTLPLLDG